MLDGQMGDEWMDREREEWDRWMVGRLEDRWEEGRKVEERMDGWVGGEEVGRWVDGWVYERIGGHLMGE